MARERSWQNDLKWYDKLMDLVEQDEDDRLYAEEQQVAAARAAQTAARRAASNQGGVLAPTQPVAPPPDPAKDTALAKAKRFVGVLAAQSGNDPGVSWAAGVFRVSGQAVVVATSNEGVGYIPAGVRWDRAARLVFDPASSPGEAPSWQGLADPARIVAQYFLRLSESHRGAELLAVASTQMMGGQVADFLSERGASLAERAAPDWGHSPQDGAHRAEVVLPGVLGTARSLHGWQRWLAAVAMLRDAVKIAHLAKAYPDVNEIVRGFEAGRWGWGWVQPVEEWERFLTRETQQHRVAEERLGPVSGGTLDRATVLPPGGGAAYALPFRAARVCSMLAVLLRRDPADRTLGVEELAEAAYEHHSVSENPDLTRRFLAHGPSGQKQQYGGAS